MREFQVILPMAQGLDLPPQAGFLPVGLVPAARNKRHLVEDDAFLDARQQEFGRMELIPIALIHVQLVIDHRTCRVTINTLVPGCSR